MPKHSFCSPKAVNFKKSDFSDDVVHQYELQDFVEKGPSGDAADFVIIKKPIEVDCYHLNKVVAERAKGTDLKSIIARVKSTGDLSLLNSRESIYGDAYIYPENRADAFDEGNRTADYLDSLSEKDKEYYLSLSKMSDEEFTAHIKKLAEQREESKKIETKVEEKVGDSGGK